MCLPCPIKHARTSAALSVARPVRSVLSSLEGTRFDRCPVVKDGVQVVHHRTCDGVASGMYPLCATQVCASSNRPEKIVTSVWASRLIIESMQIVELLSSGPHMGITAAAAWALYAATQGNRPVALAAYSSGALQPLLDLIQGGGSQVLFLTSFSTHAGEALRVDAWFGKPFHRANTGVQISAGKTFPMQDQMSAADSHSMSIQCAHSIRSALGISHLQWHIQLSSCDVGRSGGSPQCTGQYSRSVERCAAECPQEWAGGSPRQLPPASHQWCGLCFCQPSHFQCIVSTPQESLATPTYHLA